MSCAARLFRLFSRHYLLGDSGIYVYSYEEGALNGGCVEVEGSRLYIDTAGYFNYTDEIEG